MRRSEDPAPPGAQPAPLTRAQEALIERGMRTVARCAQAHVRRGAGRVTYEELLSLGSIGLMQAVRTFRPEQGTDFEVYCYKRVDGVMRYGMRKEGQFYALLWDASYTHLETTRREDPSLDEEDAGADERALRTFSDRLLTAVARRLCGAATMMEAASSEEAIARREEWSRRMRILVEEMEQTPEAGKHVLRLLYDEGASLKDAAGMLRLTPGQARGLRDRTLDDLGARVRRRCAFDPPD